MSELTPMKQQYNEIKEQHSDCLLFFRLGDFYEMFDEDARLASKELDLALTTRDRSEPDPDKRTPMCGVPYHSAQTYIARLIAKGYKVAICEQIEDPATAKGLVKRGVIRIVSPGTVTDASMLEEGRSNYLASVFFRYDSVGLAFCDISTGEFCTAAFEGENTLDHLLNELARFAPREVIMNKDAAERQEIPEFIAGKLGSMMEMGDKGFEFFPCLKRLCEQFKVESVDELGLGNIPMASCAAGALLRYLDETQKTELSHIRNVEIFGEDYFMELDWATRRSLELTESLRTGEKRGSLLWVLDKTRTPMGSRMLRAWLERPLLSPVTVKRRLSAVEELYKNNVLRAELIECLRGIGDMQRLIGRAVYGSANARDLLALSSCCRPLPRIKALLSEAKSPALHKISKLNPLPRVSEPIDRAIVDEPPFSVREGGMIKDGFDPELDELRHIRDCGAQAIAELEQKERARCGIKNIKVGYNRVFGYYIEVPRSAVREDMPADYIRKQTLTSGERYFTPELKELETKLLTAGEQIKELEYRFFKQLLDDLKIEIGEVQETAEHIAMLDCFCSFAEVAVRNGYCMPEVDASGEIIINGGRHPVVEESLKEVSFVPNDTTLNCESNRMAIITGPNMAGKSTYMRQTALITLMAQIGSFVPAKSAVIGVVDRVFTRIGASDDLASGQSTFMLEMNEMAGILNAATAKSLLILDEIGRGTSTYDGMAIARAVLEYCADKKKLGAKTMFATHYHELASLEGKVEGVKNYSISAKKQGGKLVFLRKIVPGAADDSYGIEVAKLAGIPDTVISKAKGYLREFESEAAMPKEKTKEPTEQISLMEHGTDEVGRALRAMDINSLTPLEALNVLSELQQKARG